MRQSNLFFFATLFLAYSSSLAPANSAENGTKTPDIPQGVRALCTSVSPILAKQWTGKYQSEEHGKDKSGALQTVKYQALVYSDAQGVLRARVSSEGSSTRPTMLTCGEAKKNQLVLHLLQYEGSAEPPKGNELYQPVLTLEPDPPHSWMMGFPGTASSLLNKPYLRATRLPMPPSP